MKLEWRKTSIGWRVMFIDGVEVPDAAWELAEKAAILHNAIEQTLAENGHLADGDKCTLWRLKQAIGR